MSLVTIIDYGVGNLYSVKRAFENCGATPIFADSQSGIDAAERLVLPGVGAFANGMQELRRRGLIASICRFAAEDRPLLGICLGMQMLLEASCEFGAHEGLGIIPGKVVEVPSVCPQGRRHKIPHIGWNELQLPAKRSSWLGTIFEDLQPGAAMYFVHSFMASPTDPADLLANCDYDGVGVSAAIAKGRATGCQFHPERSGPAGLSVLRRFMQSPAT